MGSGQDTPRDLADLDDDKALKATPPTQSYSISPTVLACALPSYLLAHGNLALR